MKSSVCSVVYRFTTENTETTEKTQQLDE